MAMADKIQGVEDVIGYQFTDPHILWEALQAAGSGVVSIGSRHFPDGNKRLAMLGDAILHVALIDEWYMGLEPRERASRIVQTVSTNVNLDRVARLHGLDDYVNRNRAQGLLVPTNVLTATLEAIIGAVYLDSNLYNVKSVILTLGLVPT